LSLFQFYFDVCLRRINSAFFKLLVERMKVRGREEKRKIARENKRELD